jgi:hypothetical protein
VLTLDGSVAMTVEVRREGDRIDVQVQGAAPTGGRPPWSVLLRGTEKVASVTGGKVVNVNHLSLPLMVRPTQLQSCF